MKKFVLVLASLVISTSSFAKDCTKVAYKAAKAVDAISNEASPSTYKLVSAKVIKSVRSGGETLDTVEVHMVVDEDLASFWEVDLFSSACVIKNVRFVTGD